MRMRFHLYVEVTAFKRFILLKSSDSEDELKEFEKQYHLDHPEHSEWTFIEDDFQSYNYN